MFKNLQVIYVLTYMSFMTYFSAKMTRLFYASFLNPDSNSVVAACKSVVECSRLCNIVVQVLFRHRTAAKLFFTILIKRFLFNNRLY